MYSINFYHHILLFIIILLFHYYYLKNTFFLFKLKIHSIPLLSINFYLINIIDKILNDMNILNKIYCKWIIVTKFKYSIKNKLCMPHFFIHISYIINFPPYNPLSHLPTPPSFCPYKNNSYIYNGYKIKPMIIIFASNIKFI